MSLHPVDLEIALKQVSIFKLQLLLRKAFILQINDLLLFLISEFWWFLNVGVPDQHLQVSITQSRGNV